MTRVSLCDQISSQPDRKNDPTFLVKLGVAYFVWKESNSTNLMIHTAIKTGNCEM